MNSASERVTLETRNLVKLKKQLNKAAIAVQSTPQSTAVRSTGVHPLCVVFCTSNGLKKKERKVYSGGVLGQSKSKADLFEDDCV